MVRAITSCSAGPLRPTGTVTRKRLVDGGTRMEAGVIAAVISASGAVGIGFATTFVGERYRRFHDGSALAAALAGELASYETAWPLIDVLLASLLAAAEQGAQSRLKLRPFERPRDRVYEDSVGKLGLLGVDLVESVVYVYSNIAAFRLALDLVMREHGTMDEVEFKARCEAARGCVDRAVARGASLLPALRARAIEAFFPAWSWTGR